MPKNEDGEFELILGNRQLLSVFFIVVVLLGVFFTMGYIVGRNSVRWSRPKWRLRARLRRSRWWSSRRRAVHTGTPAAGTPADAKPQPQTAGGDEAEPAEAAEAKPA